MPPELPQLRAQLPACLAADRRRIARMLDQAARLLGQRRPAGRLLGLAAREIERSRQQRDARLAARPGAITYPEELPVSARRQEIAQAIAQHQVIILCGETGSGKTTQLPKICLELGRGVEGMIGHTQPRRIAARAVAGRIAQELGCSLGSLVGFKVRFTDRVAPTTAIKLMTDGILLSELRQDRLLEAYDTIIIDEAHERSLNIDFLLGCLKQLLPRRPDLRVIITSATIDPERFSRHFGQAPIITVSGRTYPVEVLYRPLAGDDPDTRDQDLPDAMLAAVDELCGRGPGDILIFLPGEREIYETAQLLRKQRPGVAEVLPLYARLSADEQMRVFRPHSGRRIILATNVAETSLTVPGIRYVIDPGYARLSRYAARTGVQRLQIERISQASANQRQGRCGRVAEGVCIRLYSEADFQARPVYTDPEILRSNLAGVILQMKSLGLGDIQAFPFLDPPDYKAVRDGFATLHELGAIDETNQLTDIGHQLARLPVDPRLGRIILAARQEDCLREVLIIAAALAIDDPRQRPLERQDLADAAHAKFLDETSDFLSYLKLWEWYHQQRLALSAGKLRKVCQENFLSHVRLREWCDVHHQLLELVRELDEPRPTPGGHPAAPRDHPAPTDPFTSARPRR